MALDEGWLHIERGTGNAMQVLLGGVPPWKISKREKILFRTDLPGDDHVGAAINVIERIITCFDLYFKTLADVELFQANMDVLNLAGTMTVELQVDSTPTYAKLDGTNTSLEMFCTDVRDWQIVALGGGTVYKIKSVNFKQGG